MNKETHAVDAHTAAAQEHENTAKGHRTAAEHCNKGNHEACQHHAKVALDQSVKAHEASTVAHEKSSQPVAVGSKS
jgi:hypothetical protein